MQPGADRVTQPGFADQLLKRRGSRGDGPCQDDGIGSVIFAPVRATIGKAVGIGGDQAPGLQTGALEDAPQLRRRRRNRKCRTDALKVFRQAGE